MEKHTDKLVQEKFNAFRKEFNSFRKKNHLEPGISKQEIDDFQIKVFSGMQKTPYKNSYLIWSSDDDLRLLQMYKLEIPYEKVAQELGRTEMAVIRRIQDLKRETILESLSEFVGALYEELSDQLSINEEVFSEKINNIFIDKQFESLKQEISKKNYNDEKIEFKIKPKKKKRGRGRPRKDATTDKYDGFIMESKPACW